MAGPVSHPAIEDPDRDRRIERLRRSRLVEVGSAELLLVLVAR
jgi:hypothetical protein